MRMRVAVTTVMQVNKHTTAVASPSELPTDNVQHDSEVVAKDVEKEASGMVKQMIANSLHRLAKPPITSAKIHWPTGAEITPQKGVEAIEACIQTWAVDPSWKHSTKYLGQEGSQHKYCVQWSIPTRRRPVPRATASVYFFFQPQDKVDAPMLVFYVVEGQRLVHRPEQTVFQEIWLRNTIDNKLATTQGASLLLHKIIDK